MNIYIGYYAFSWLKISYKSEAHFLNEPTDVSVDYLFYQITLSRLLQTHCYNMLRIIFIFSDEKIKNLG